MSPRWRDAISVGLIGDGVLAAWIPRRHAARWMVGPKWWLSMMRPFVRNPLLTRLTGLLELAAGLWLAGKTPSR